MTLCEVGLSEHELGAVRMTTQASGGTGVVGVWVILVPIPPLSSIVESN